MFLFILNCIFICFSVGELSHYYCFFCFACFSVHIWIFAAVKVEPNVVFLLFCLFFIDFRELQLAVLQFSKLEKELNYRYIVSQCCVVVRVCLFTGVGWNAFILKVRQSKKIKSAEMYRTDFEDNIGSLYKRYMLVGRIRWAEEKSWLWVIYDVINWHHRWLVNWKCHPSF